MCAVLLMLMTVNAQLQMQMLYHFGGTAGKTAFVGVDTDGR